MLQPRGNARLHQQAINDDFNGVILALVDHRQIIERKKFTVDAHADVTILRKLFQFFAVGAFSSADDGRKDHDAVFRLAEFSVQDGLNNLLTGLPGDGLTAVGAMRGADGGVNHAEVVVNFGDGADGGPRRTRSSFLLDGDGRRQPLDNVHLGAFHLIEKLPRIRGQRFHVPPLALRVDGVERQRGLAGTGKSGDDGQRIARNLDVDIFEVVLPSAANNQFGQTHDGKRCLHRSLATTARKSWPE